MMFDRYGRKVTIVPPAGESPEHEIARILARNDGFAQLEETLDALMPSPTDREYGTHPDILEKAYGRFF